MARAGTQVWVRAPVAVKQAAALAVAARLVGAAVVVE